jgi:hypothetical protein
MHIREMIDAGIIDTSLHHLDQGVDDAASAS